MATFDVRHPDVFEFIRAKREDGRLRQFNLSLLITEDFIEAVKNDQAWQLAFPVRANEVEEQSIDLSDPESIIWRDWPTHENLVVNDEGLVACLVNKTLPARRLWDTIMASTYDYAEPGFILIDKVNEMNNNWYCENIRATNPCGLSTVHFVKNKWDSLIYKEQTAHSVDNNVNHSYVNRNQPLPKANTLH